MRYTKDLSYTCRCRCLGSLKDAIENNAERVTLDTPVKVIGNQSGPEKSTAQCILGFTGRFKYDNPIMNDNQLEVLKLQHC